MSIYPGYLPRFLIEFDDTVIFGEEGAKVICRPPSETATRSRVRLQEHERSILRSISYMRQERGERGGFQKKRSKSMEGMKHNETYWSLFVLVICTDE